MLSNISLYANICFFGYFYFLMQKFSFDTTIKTDLTVVPSEGSIAFQHQKSLPCFPVHFFDKRPLINITILCLKKSGPEKCHKEDRVVCLSCTHRRYLEDGRKED